MTGTKLQELLDAHCLEMKANMPGFRFSILWNFKLQRWNHSV